MKKKSINLERKLFLNKEIVAELNTLEQALLLGGDELSLQQGCVTQDGRSTCVTFPPMGENCIFC